MLYTGSCVQHRAQLHAADFTMFRSGDPMVATAADCLYNATHYAIPLLQTLLGTHNAFDSKECYVDSSNTPASGGQLAAWHGTELGSRRDRALIAYDRNVNFQAFVTPCFDFAKA